ncbi:COG4280 domain-containing protein [Pseudooceanicola nitratireducens]|uniref:COG4280 domain-containing protein n=1 Tax=Pseudooceanicola nitratireducens TaxID=517719 RepID=UPI003511A386
MLDWSTEAPALIAAFTASLVEVVEAFTIVLVVATLQGWRAAILGTAAALAVLAVIVAVLGPMIGLVPFHLLQLVIGVLLLLFGAGWLRKASLRAAGVVALHDETQAFAKGNAALSGKDAWIGGLAAFKAVLLEGLEVAFIVVAVGAGHGTVIPASLGALAACIIVLVVGALLHRPLARVPENTLKFGVGVMLTAFGTFWTGEALGVAWPGADLMLLVLAAIYLGLGLLMAQIVRRPEGAHT